MTLGGKSMGHAHEAAAPEGIGTVDQKFDTMGNLAIIVESIEVDNSSITDFAQFNLNVVPEFPIGLAFVAGGIFGSVILITRLGRIV